jgi:hypothetical protein
MRKSTIIRATYQLVAAIFALTFIACGGKATYSAPVGVNLNARAAGFSTRNATANLQTSLTFNADE